MPISDHELEQLAATFQRMSLLMSDIAREHREAGREDSARQCVGVSEGMSMAATYTRLEIPVEGHRLKVVS